MPYVIRITVPRLVDDHVDTPEDPSKIQETTPEDAVRKVLNDNGIQEQVWRLSENQKFYTVEFQVYEGSVSDSIVDQLAYYNIGKKENTSIMIIEPTVTISNRNGQSIDNKNDLNDNGPSMNLMSSERFKKFVKSLKSRITIAQIYESIRHRSAFDVNYLAFLLCAAIVADVALVTNSVASVFASMLLSPLMDPIMCVVYGLVLRERTLLRKGLRNGLVSLLICVLTGFVFGIPCHYVAQFEETSPYPTNEMRSRARAQGLVSSLIVATFSGLSVAFANLQNSVAALIGNAISLSLLPPAVNSGLYLFLACLAVLQRDQLCSRDEVVTVNGTSQTIPCNYIHMRNYQPIYMKSPKDLPIEYAISSGVSFLLTCINIILIIITGYIVNKVKDLSPKSFTNNITRTFYKEDDIHEMDGNNYLCITKATATDLAHQAWQNYLTLTEGNQPKDIERKTFEFSAVADSISRDKCIQRLGSSLGNNWLGEFQSATKELAEQNRQQSQQNCVVHHTINAFENLTSNSANSSSFLPNYNQFSLGPMTTLRNYSIRDLQLSSTGNMHRYNQIRDMTRHVSSDLEVKDAADINEGHITAHRRKRLFEVNSTNIASNNKSMNHKHANSFDVGDLGAGAGSGAGGDMRKNSRRLMNKLFPLSSKNQQQDQHLKGDKNLSFDLGPVSEIDDENMMNSRRSSTVKFIESSMPTSRKNSSQTNIDSLNNDPLPTVDTNPIHKSNSAHSTASMTGRFSVVKTEFVNTPTNPNVVTNFPTKSRKSPRL